MLQESNRKKNFLSRLFHLLECLFHFFPTLSFTFLKCLFVFCGVSISLPRLLTVHCLILRPFLVSPARPAPTPSFSQQRAMSYVSPVLFLAFFWGPQCSRKMGNIGDKFIRSTATLISNKYLLYNNNNSCLFIKNRNEIN